MRGVILAGGHGTRMEPATLHTNKHLLPLYSSQGAVPMIVYPINTLVSSGITDILIISSREHCGPIIENLGDGEDFGADFTYRIQDVSETKPLGIASALKLAEGFVDGAFAVLLGDNFFSESFADHVREFEENNPDAMVFLSGVSDPQRFGVFSTGVDGVMTIEEKPREPKSNLAVTGLYFYRSIGSGNVFSKVQTLRPSGRGELEITDINHFYCQKGTMVAKTCCSFWSDMGVPESLARTQRHIEDSGFKINLPLFQGESRWNVSKRKRN